MEFLEKDLESIIFETDNKILSNRGLGISGIKKRQLHIGNYGTCDIITFSKAKFSELCAFHVEKMVIEIFELKKNIINIQAFMQCLRYAQGVQSWLSKEKGWILNADYELHLALIGKEIDLNDSLCYLPNVFENVRFYIYKYKHDGIYFKNIWGYSLINEF